MMDEATQRQVMAAAPGLSTWLSANAGSGKTRVLTDRVARLLLGGADPARILCLTYTKAAAAEMQNRLFKRLGAWAMLDDAALTEALAGLGEAVEDAGTLARARRLFARALETPGGLKIQTIHAFCGAILRRFPLEAGIPPDFTEVDERGLQALRDEVLEALVAGPGGAALEALLTRLSDGKLRAILTELERLDPAALKALPDPNAVFDLPPGLDPAGLLAQVLPVDPSPLLEILPALAAGGPTDGRLAERLAVLKSPGAGTLEALEGPLLFGKTAQAGAFASKAGRIPTKAMRKSLPPAAIDMLDALADRLADARPQRLALEAATQTAALWAFARHWIPAITAAKSARGWLKFDDLITRTRRLLDSPSVAQWVLFKLDGGIDHILVDEAQDTAPGQWQIIERLVAELSAGDSARARPSSLFVVGDRKQSIYSFQGADLAGLQAVHDRIAADLARLGQPLSEMQLLHSFRSSPAVLRVVDLAFADAPEAPGSGGLGGPSQHLAFFARMPGRVDLWPALPAPEKDEGGDWDDPLDRPAETHPDLLLARAVAAEIRRLIDAGTPIGDTGRPMHEGDVLILVRRRKGLLFDALLLACKAQGLAMAGADRLILSDEPAVVDVLALLRALALPEDDLSLATALRSALFGWSEDRLFRLAHGRGRLPLIARLRDNPDSAETLGLLNDLRDATDFLRPYELIERILGHHDGRRRLLARYGPEAEEPLEALCELALAFEGAEIPSLDGFLIWLDASDAELKRQAESAGERLRIMTVHGAKGLEAPLVILPDTADRRPNPGGVLTWLDGLPVPRGTADTATPRQLAATAAEAELRVQEGDRLLYVAMTRAERWLIVAGAGKTDAPEGWYGRVAAAIEAAGAERIETPLGPGWRHAHGDWPAPAAAARSVRAAAIAVPALHLTAPPARRAVLSPSALGGAKALPGEAGEAAALALARGTLMHLLLETLPAHPPARWPALAETLARPLAPDLPRDILAESLAEARDLLGRPGLAALFGPEWLPEVPVQGEWSGRPLRGIIDRLRIDGQRLRVVDLKTNRVVPDNPRAIPEGILRQMGAYAHLLAAIHPGKEIECAILWTVTGQLMAIPAELTRAALQRAAQDPAALDPMAAET